MLVTADTNGFQPVQVTAPAPARHTATPGQLALTGATGAQITLAQWALMGAVLGLLVFGSPVMFRARRSKRMITLLEQVPLTDSSKS